MFMEAHSSWFATSLGDDMLRLYPLARWRRFRDELRAQGEEGEDVAFHADRIGYEVNVAAYGRVLTPPDWRKCHSMNRIEVEMYWNRDHILVLTKDQARAERAFSSNMI